MRRVRPRLPPAPVRPGQRLLEDLDFRPAPPQPLADEEFTPLPGEAPPLWERADVGPAPALHSAAAPQPR
eukprot:11157441-Lingulodinium_polyedra.AAC.1